MRQSPSEDFTAASASLKDSPPAARSSVSSAPWRRQFKQSPFLSREPEWHSAQRAGSSTTTKGVSDIPATAMAATLFPRRERRRDGGFHHSRSPRFPRSW